MTFYFENFLRELLTNLKQKFRAIEKQWNKAVKFVKEGVQTLVVRAERSLRLSVARVKDSVRERIEQIPLMIDDAFTVDSPQKAAKMAEIYGEELSTALYETQLRIDGLQNAIIRAAAPLAQAVLPIVNTAVKALTVLSNTVGKILAAFVEGSLGIKLYESSLKSAVETTASASRYLAGFDQIQRIGSSGSGLAGMLIPESNQVIPGWQALADKIIELAEPLKKIDLSPAVEGVRKALKALEPVLDAVLEAAQWAWQNLLVPVATWAAENVLPAFLEVLTTALQTLGQIIEQIRPVLSWLWENFFQKLAQWYGERIIANIQAMGEKFQSIGETIGKYMPIVQGIIEKIDTLLGLGKGLQSDASLWQSILNVLAPAMDTLNLTMSLLPGPIGAVMGILSAFFQLLNNISGGFDGLGASAQEAVGIIQEVLGDLLGFTQTNVMAPAEDGTKKFLNKVIGYFESSIRGISSAYNQMFAGMGENLENIETVAPSVGSIGRRLKQMQMPAIPRLAQGAVLPANKPFLAVVGDQTHGTNVEAPLRTIQQALDLTLQDRLEGMMAGFNAVTDRQEQILEAILGLDVSDGALAGAVKRYERRMAYATGGV